MGERKPRRFSAKAFNMVQSFRSGKTISVAPSAPVEVPPPLPPVE